MTSKMNHLSANKAIWKQREANVLLYNILKNKFRISSQLARILSSREGINEDNFIHFLTPKLRNLLPDPNSLRDMCKAVERTNEAILNKEKICVFADY